MKAARKPRRVFYEILSRRDEVVEVDAVSKRRYQENIKCPSCTEPRTSWDKRAIPVDLIITEEVHGCVARASMMGDLIRNDLFGVLQPYLEGVVVGAVHIVDDRSGRRRLPYVTCFVPRHLELEAYRGRYCRHHRCRECGRFSNEIMWASGAIVERYLDKRLVYLDLYRSLFVDGDLARTLRLKERFPDMRLYRFDVIPEPLDGDVMPGDPGWDGTFRPQKSKPEPPRIPPPRGRYTDDGTEDEAGPGIVTLYLPGEPAEDSLLDVPELEKALIKTVRGAKAGELEQSGLHPRKRAWHARFRGPNTIRLYEVMKHGLRRFETRLPKKWHMTGRFGSGRERRINL